MPIASPSRPPKPIASAAATSLRPNTACRSNAAWNTSAPKQPEQPAAVDYRGKRPQRTPHPFNRHSVKLSTAAKLTHAKYGTSNHPAPRLTRKNTTIVAAIAAQSSSITTSASPILCIPKNTGLHAAFSASCTTNNPSASRCRASPPRFHTNHAATAIAAYSTVHTGPNTQPGGFQLGLFRLAYHAPGMKNDPTAAAPKHSASHTTNPPKRTIAPEPAVMCSRMARQHTGSKQISTTNLKRWLTKATQIQWDYKNIVKRKGKLLRLP